MKEEMITISEADLKACEEDMRAYYGMAVSLFEHCLQIDPNFKNDWLYMRAKEVLWIRESEV